MTDGPGGRPPPWTAPADELAVLVATLGLGDAGTAAAVEGPAETEAIALERLVADVAASLEVAADEIAIAPTLEDGPDGVAAASIVGHPGPLAERLTGRVSPATPLESLARLDPSTGSTEMTWRAFVAATDRETTLLVDSKAIAPDDAAALLRAFIGGPAGAWPAASLSDPMAARDRAWSSGLASTLSDAVILAGPQLAPTSARIVRSTGPNDRFRTIHDISTTDGGWRLEPVGPTTNDDDRHPFVSAAQPVILARGDRADRILGRALAEGTEAAETRRCILEWWDAVGAMRESGPDGRMPFDLRPRDFVIDPDGSWHHTGGRIRHRMAIPTEALLIRGLSDLVATTLRSRWVTGAEPDTTMAAIVSGLARHVGTTLDPTSWQVWAAIDVSATERSAADPPARSSLQDASLERLDRSVGSFWAGLPLPERVRAAVDLAGARRVRDVTRAHESLRVEVLEATRTGSSVETR